MGVVHRKSRLERNIIASRHNRFTKRTIFTSSAKSLVKSTDFIPSRSTDNDTVSAHKSWAGVFFSSQMSRFCKLLGPSDGCSDKFRTASVSVW